ncbi:ATP-grasp domain-containing protein [Vreelandella nigrificans]|nr:ATP-grasp domain-containing protein [Halomonas nigrificans]
MTKPVAIVLGGTVPHKFLIENLKKRGYKTILIDYYENPPAASIADVHIKESALDACIVEKIAQKNDAALVICAALDQPLPVSITVSEKLNLPIPFNSEVAYNLTNKSAMKRVMKKTGIPTPEWHCVETMEDAYAHSIPLPFIVKPEDGTGSKGITIVENEQNFEEALQLAFNASMNGKIIIEEFFNGLELSVDCVVKEGVSKVILFRERHKCDKNGSAKGTQCVATISPANIPESTKKSITKIMSLIANAFNVKNGVLLAQLIIKSNQQVTILEIAGRVSGGPGGFVAVKKKTGIDMLDIFLRAYLGEEINITINDDSRHYITGSLYCSEGILGSFINFEELIKAKIVDGLFLYKNRGEEVSHEFSTKSRVAGFSISADSRNELKEKINTMYNQCDILDKTGKSIFLRQVGVHKCL